MTHTWQLRHSHQTDRTDCSADARTGEADVANGRSHCTFCTIANTTVGVLIGVAPVATPLLTGRADLALWGLPLTLLILGYTARRVGHVGFLPGADRMAHATGLSRVVGPHTPGHHDGSDARTDTTATERRQQ